MIVEASRQAILDHIGTSIMRLRVGTIVLSHSYKCPLSLQSGKSCQSQLCRFPAANLCASRRCLGLCWWEPLRWPQTRRLWTRSWCWCGWKECPWQYGKAIVDHSRAVIGTGRNMGWSIAENIVLGFIFSESRFREGGWSYFEIYI